MASVGRTVCPGLGIENWKLQIENCKFLCEEVLTVLLIGARKFMAMTVHSFVVPGHGAAKLDRPPSFDFRL